MAQVIGPEEIFGIYCPREGGKFVICHNDDGDFLGCVTDKQAPCEINTKYGGHIPQELVQPMGFEKDKYSDIPTQDCDDPKGPAIWYVCQKNEIPFVGCCKSNPCNGVGCPEDNLVPAKFSKNPANAAAFLPHLVNGPPPNTGPTTTTSTGTTLTTAATSTASSAAATTTQANAPTNGQGSGISGGMIGGILGGVAAIVMFGAFVLYKVKKSQQHAHSTRPESPDHVAGLPENGDPGVFDSGYYRGARRSNLTGAPSTNPIPLTAVTANRYSATTGSMGSPPSSPPASPQAYHAYPAGHEAAGGDSQSPSHAQVGYPSPFAHLQNPRGYEPVAAPPMPISELDSSPVYMELEGSYPDHAPPNSPAAVSPPPAPRNDGQGQYQQQSGTYDTPSTTPTALMPGQGAGMHIAKNF